MAERTGIAALRRTTRDEPNYDVLMRGRLEILAEHGLTMPLVQDVIGELELLPGARAFLDALRERTQVLILSDTFEQFAQPFMRQLGWPTLTCHRLVVTDGWTAPASVVSVTFVVSCGWATVWRCPRTVTSCSVTQHRRTP